jgi:hypothetical protein
VTDVTQWRAMLMAENPVGQVLAWLKAEFLPLVLDHMNSADVRRRIGLYGGDRIPENERNLTDVRNRVSLVAEYELARVATRILEERELGGLFFSYVVANRFPDLELRDEQGKRGIRVEVKCLASVAEEKSANFDTLKKDVNPNTDFVVVFLWEWKRDGSVIGPGTNRALSWDRAPTFLRVFCFHAASLAHMRDWYWLNKPPADPGDGLQGFDLRYAVNCSSGTYNQEEGNYGKLMRMWSEGSEPVPERSIFLDETPAEYLKFRRDVIEEGFIQVCQALVAESMPSSTASGPLILQDRSIGWLAGESAFVLASLCPRAAQTELLRSGQAARLFAFSDRYSWSEFTLSGGRATKVDEGKKPKHLKHRLHQGPT